MKLSRSLLVLSLLVASCSFGPDYENPPPTVLESSWKNAGFSAPVPEGSWWTLFGDAKLNAYMREAESRSPAMPTNASNAFGSCRLPAARTVP